MFSHLEAIQLRLTHERTRRDAASGKEREWREHNCRMIIREVEGEVAFLKSKGVHVPDWRSCTEEIDANDDQLLKDLGL